VPLVTRVLVCSPIRLYGEGLAAVLGTRNDIEVAGCSTSPTGCLQLAEQVKPQVVVLDMAMTDAVRLVAALVERTPEVQVVALGVTHVDAAVLACAEPGAAASTSRL
jgi:DNA-binding NarL/FixJ family response regulator